MSKQKIQTFYLRQNVKQGAYRDLVQVAGECCAYGVLVVQKYMNLEDPGQQVISRLKRFLVDQKTANEWPGTRILGERAEVYEFRLNEYTLPILTESVSSLYDWHQPNFPEDLCFLREDHSQWMAASSPNGSAVFELTLDEKTELESRVSGLELHDRKWKIGL